MRVFISYSHSDSSDIASMIAHDLSINSIEVWFDKLSIRPGDSITRAIDKGILKFGGENGVVILSPAYLKNNWTQWELGGLIQLLNAKDSTSRIIPIWHNLSYNDVVKYSSALADIQAIKSENYSISELLNSFTNYE